VRPSSTACIKHANALPACLLPGHAPYSLLPVACSPALLLQHILSGKYDIPRDPPLSPDCIDLIHRMLVRDPGARITLEQIQQHPWFLTGVGSGSLAQQSQVRAE